MFSASSLRIPINFEPATFIAVADLSIVAERTALVGGASFLEAFVMVPGMHRQQSADAMNNGESPQAASLTNEYIFNIENPGTVSYLQRIGRAGYLVTASVTRKREADFPCKFLPYYEGVVAALLYLLCPISTIAVLAFLGSIRDWWALGVLGALVLSRTINVFVIKRRTSGSSTWKGAKESGRGDLLIVLSQNRWVRLQGELSDVKQVTAGQWLREMSVHESLAISSATVLVYASSAFVGNATNVGGWLIACLMLYSLALLGLCNSKTQCLQMYDCIVRQTGEPQPYTRRLEMVKAVVGEFNHSDWAIRMGLIRSRADLEPPKIDGGGTSERIETTTTGDPARVK